MTSLNLSLLHLIYLVTLNYMEIETYLNQNSEMKQGMGCLCGLSLLFDYFCFPYIRPAYSSSHLLARFLCLSLEDLSELGFHSKNKIIFNYNQIYLRVCHLYLEMQVYNLS